MTHSDKLHKTNSMEKWRCPKCEFDNLNIMPNCQMCDEPKTREPKKDLQSSVEKSTVEPGIECPDKKCQFLNPLTCDFCKKCSQPLFPDSDNEEQTTKKQKPKVQLVACSYCSFQNDPTNLTCLNCERKLKVRRIPKKSARTYKAARYMAGGSKECPTCGAQLRIIDYTTHQTDICMDCEEKHPTQFNKNLCLFCDKKIPFSQSTTHDTNCEQRIKFFKKEGNPTFDRCTPLQYETMVYMHKKCEKLHYKKEKQLITRIKGLGYTQKDLQNLHHYIIHYAPIIIHMHVNTHFGFFLSDTHYRNQFETSKSSGALSSSARTQWEDRMFDKKHHNATGYQRVKYGTMNFVNDPKGVKCCAGYGQSYFLLKTHVRDRCTITDMDSSSPSSTLGTFRFIFHLLMKLSDPQLKSAFEGSKGIEMKSHVIGTYKEIQIHGPVQFSKDIQRVYISKDELKLGDAKALLEQVKTFCSKHSIDYELFENDPLPGYSPLGFGVVAGVGIAQKPAEQRIIGDKKQLNQEDLRPKPVPGVGAGFGFGGAMHPFGYIAPAPLPLPSASLFPSLSFARYPPPIPPKKKQYGVDYI